MANGRSQQSGAGTPIAGCSTFALKVVVTPVEPERSCDHRVRFRSANAGSARGVFTTVSRECSATISNTLLAGGLGPRVTPMFRDRAQLDNAIEVCCTDAWEALDKRVVGTVEGDRWCVCVVRGFGCRIRGALVSDLVSKRVLRNIFFARKAMFLA